MPETWNDFGFPDELHFRTFRLPFTGLSKAFNERANAVSSVGPDSFEPLIIPDYFTPLSNPNYAYGVASFDFNLSLVCQSFVNPSKIQPNKAWRSYFWTMKDLMLSVVDDPSELIIADMEYYKPFMPALSVKWALQRYHAINKLRYICTVRKDYPDFEYEDFYLTFNFKE